MREAGAIEALLGCLKAEGGGEAKEVVQLAALRTLNLLAIEAPAVKSLLKAGAVPTVLELAQQGSEALNAAAARLLLALASSSKSAGKAVVEGGGLPALLPLLRGGGGLSAIAVGHLARLLASTAQESPETRKALAAAGALPELAAFLINGNQAMAPGRGAAVDALAALCSDEGSAAGEQEGSAVGGEGSPAGSPPVSGGKALRQELCGLHGLFALLGFLHTTDQAMHGLSELLR